MNWTSIIAIYALFWVISAFVILPLGVRNHHEVGEPMSEGQDTGAPVNFRPAMILWRTTILSAIVFGLYYLNFHYGWIDRHSFDFLVNP
jgi:predicted secreted protein